MSNSLPKVEAFLSDLKEQHLFKDEKTQGSVLCILLSIKREQLTGVKPFAQPGLSFCS